MQNIQKKKEAFSNTKTFTISFFLIFKQIYYKFNCKLRKIYTI